MKFTTWNVEHSSRLIGSEISDINRDRRNRVKNTIREINPDVLCMIEGPKGEEDAISFALDVLANEWSPLLLKTDEDDLESKDKEYAIKGTQWIWFYVRSTLIDKCYLQHPSVWQSYTGLNKWDVHYWGEQKPTKHSHYRHPQVMIMDLGQGKEIELIGLHMKSKINQNPINKDSDGNIIGAYLEEALRTRIKLATEARNVRAYIDARFEQTPSPAILVMGDANDGPGQDYFETKYMFFDLLSNLQGSVMKSDRFFNHALFDYPEELRWTAKYRNKVMNIPASRNPLLIDHILMSQALVSGKLPYKANSGGGFVEHQAFERGNVAASSKRKTSDHRAVSIILEDSDSHRCLG